MMRGRFNSASARMAKLKCHGLSLVVAVGILVTGAVAIAQGVPDIMSSGAGAKPAAGATTGTSTQPAGARPNATTQALMGTNGTTSNTTAGGATPSAVLDQTTLSFVDELKMAKGTSERVKARLSDVVRVTDQNLREKITVNGTVSYEDAGSGKTRAIVNWTSVAREEASRRKVLTQPLESRFSSDSVVPSGQAINARGDVEGMLAAARALLEDDTKKTDDKATQTTKTDRNTADSTGTKPATASGAGASENGIVTSSVPSSSTTKTVTQAADVLGESTTGCSPRVDLTQAVVIVQSQVTTNGAASGECSDTATRYPIVKSYTVCPDKVVAETKKAYPQYKNYFVNGDGSTTYIDKDCVTDTETAYDVVEDAASCTVDVDLTGLLAYRRAETVYTNKNGQRVVVASCHRVAGQTALAVSLTEDGCSPRNDFTAKVSYQKKAAIYTLDGSVVTAQACTETGKTYAHVEDRASCPPLVDTAANKAWPQRKWKITLESGMVQTIADCAPVTEEVTDIVKTRTGCEGLYAHDISAGQSFGQSRWFYNLGNGPVYVTSCQKDPSIAFTHQIRITSYQNNDTNKTAKPLTEIYLFDGSSEVMVSAGQVRAGAADLPYVLQQSGIVTKTGNSTYTGCDAYRETALSDVYKRPDGTSYTEAKGAGTPEGPFNVCVSTVVQTGALDNLWFIVQSAGDAGWTYGAGISYVSKTQFKNTETGAVISTTCQETGTSSRTTTLCPWCIGGYNSICANNGGICYAGTGTPWPGFAAAYPNGSCPAGF